MQTSELYLNHCKDYKLNNSLNDLMYLDIDTKRDSFKRFFSF